MRRCFKLRCGALTEPALLPCRPQLTKTAAKHLPVAAARNDDDDAEDDDDDDDDDPMQQVSGLRPRSRQNGLFGACGCCCNWCGRGNNTVLEYYIVRTGMAVLTEYCIKIIPVYALGLGLKRKL